MSVILSPKKTKKQNVYLEKIAENLISFLRTVENFDEALNELSQLAKGATGHISDMEGILGSHETDDDDGEEDDDEEQKVDSEREAMAADKLCTMNENLNLSLRNIRQCWNTLEKHGTTLAKSVYKLPKLTRLFLDTTKNDVDFNDIYTRTEIDHLNEQLTIIGRFYYELCLEIQVRFLDLSTMKAIKQLTTCLDLLCSRSVSMAVSLQIIRQIQTNLCIS